MTPEDSMDDTLAAAAQPYAWRITLGDFGLTLDVLSHDIG